MKDRQQENAGGNQVERPDLRAVCEGPEKPSGEAGGYAESGSGKLETRGASGDNMPLDVTGRDSPDNTHVSCHAAFQRTRPQPLMPHTDLQRTLLAADHDGGRD